MCVCAFLEERRKVELFPTTPCDFPKRRLRNSSPTSRFGYGPPSASLAILTGLPTIVALWLEDGRGREHIGRSKHYHFNNISQPRTGFNTSSVCVFLGVEVVEKSLRLSPFSACLTHTCILSTESENELALWMRYVCSIYSVSRCRKLKGSLNITGMVILDSSYFTRKRKR